MGVKSDPVYLHRIRWIYPSALVEGSLLRLLWREPTRDWCNAISLPGRHLAGEMGVRCYATAIASHVTLRAALKAVGEGLVNVNGECRCQPAT